MNNLFQTPDFTKAFEAYFKAVPATFTESTAEATALASKIGEITLAAAQRNVELSAAWAQDVLANAADLNKQQAAPADYAKTAAAIATNELQATPERIAAFAEVAKKAQVETVELLMSAGKDMQAKFTKAA
mgnify:CR=1 FL=1